MKPIKIISLILFIVLLSTSVFAGSLTAHVDREQVAVDESFDLILSTDTQDSFQANPDLTELEKDFTVLGITQGQQIKVLNGVTSAQSQWIIKLAPNHEGTLTIPEIKIGNLTSNSLILKVTKQSQTVGKTGKETGVFIETSVSEKNPYVQSQLMYTVKIYYNIQIVDPVMTAPKLENSQIKSLDNDVRYQTNYHGKTYQVLEKSFLIIPQKAGSVTIMPPALKGVKASYQANSDPFEAFINGGGHAQSFIVRGEPIQLTVRDKPSSANNKWWLPAKNVEINESWSTPINNLKVGEPVTRTITISATGVTAEDLPQLPQTSISGVNSYPDAKPVLESGKKGVDLIARRTEKTVYIPTQPGQITLPAVKINWWNTQTNKQEVAVLPAQILKTQGTVANAVTTTTPKPLTTIDSANQSVNTANNPATTSLSNKLSEKLDISKNNPWILISAALISLWIITLFIWIAKKRRRSDLVATIKTIAATEHVATSEINKLFEKIKSSAMENDPVKTKNNLLQWASAKWQQPYHNLQEIAEKFRSEEIKQAFANLDKSIYSYANKGWQGDDFWKVFISNYEQQTKDRKKSQESDLADLYLN